MTTIHDGSCTLEPGNIAIRWAFNSCYLQSLTGRAVVVHWERQHAHHPGRRVDLRRRPLGLGLRGSAITSRIGGSPQSKPNDGDKDVGIENEPGIM